MSRLEVYGSQHCPYTKDLCEELEWQGQAFDYYDVDRDPEALKRMLVLTQQSRHVPVVVKAGELQSIGYQGRSCIV